MAVRIIAQSTEGHSYIIGDGDPAADPMMPVVVVDADEGAVYTPPIPLQQVFKFGTWKDAENPDDQDLIARLEQFPEVRQDDLK